MKKTAFVILMIFFSAAIGIAQKTEKAEKNPCPPYDEPGMTYDANPIVDAIDVNKDGKMTHEEWQAKEAPEPSWQMFNSKPDIKSQGYITREQFLAETPPNGIDLNCDGKITIEEFVEFGKQGPPGGPDMPPPGGQGPPQGGQGTPPPPPPGK
jgi:hypothetical protein